MHQSTFAQETRIKTHEKKEKKHRPQESSNNGILPMVTSNQLKNIYKWVLS